MAINKIQSYITVPDFTLLEQFKIHLKQCFKGIVSPDWKGLQMVSLDRFEV
jgi:hypothetical protein